MWSIGWGHGHDDLLHVSYTHRDKDILIDSGRYSYEVSKGRLDYKAPYAHNTIVVDDQNFNHHTDAWNSEKSLHQSIKNCCLIQVFTSLKEDI